LFSFVVEGLLLIRRGNFVTIEEVLSTAFVKQARDERLIVVSLKAHEGKGPYQLSGNLLLADDVIPIYRKDPPRRDLICDTGP
jgi:hypothetical protein